MSVFGIVPLVAAATAPGGSEWIHLGEPFTIDRETPIQKLVEHPEQYHNKDVKISGIVASICNEEGCFIEVVPKNGKGEGVVVNFPGLKHMFPLDCAGREAVVEGLFYQKIYPSARMSHWQHNGKAETLEEIWTRFNPYDLHGVTNDMTKDQLNDLVEYLKTL